MKRKRTIRDRIDSDPELKAILEDDEFDDWFVERVKQGHREWRERRRREQERRERLDCRRRLIRRLTFGLLPR